MKTKRKIHLLIAFLAGTMILFGCAVYNQYQPTLPVSDIVQMSKDGMPSKDIIKDIRKTHSVYMLKADELASLSREGVQDSVLNYMDKTRINTIRQNERFYGGYPYDYWYGYGWPYGFGMPYGFWGNGPTIIYHGNSGGHYHGHGGRVRR